MVLSFHKPVKAHAKRHTVSTCVQGIIAGALRNTARSFRCCNGIIHIIVMCMTIKVAKWHIHPNSFIKEVSKPETCSSVPVKNTGNFAIGASCAGTGIAITGTGAASCTNRTVYLGIEPIVAWYHRKIVAKKRPYTYSSGGSCGCASCLRAGSSRICGACMAGAEVKWRRGT